jgi:hypothetical protein
MLFVYNWLYLGEQASKLNCAHRELDELLKCMLANLNKQVIS